MFNFIPVIEKSHLFQNVKADIIEELAEHCQLKKIGKGQSLFEAGDTANGFFIILEGWIKLYRISRMGEEIIIHVFGPDESFAEAAVFRDNPQYPVSAEALGAAQLIEVPRSFFIQKIKEDPNFALCILGAIASHQHYLVQQLEQVTTRTAPQRIGAFLLRFCKETNTKDIGGSVVDLPYDKAVISSRLNIKPETFSRALSKLEPYGVEPKGRSILIHDREKLATYCDCIETAGAFC